MKCYLCKSKKLRIIRNKLRYGIKRNVFKCQSCGLVFLEDSPLNCEKYYREKYRAIYTPILGKPCTPQETFKIYSGLQKYRLNIFKSILSGGKKVLDIGCSGGSFLQALKGLVKERVGIDFDKNSAQFARKKLGIKVYTVPIQNTDLPKKYFDIIFILHVLEHINDPVGFLQQVKQYLKPNGYLCVEVPNVENFLINIYGLEEFKAFYFTEPHLFYFSPDTLKAVIEKAGFSGKIYTHQLYNIMNQFHWLFSKKPQPEPIIGMSSPVLFKDTRNQRVKKILNNFIKTMDDEFKNTMNRFKISDAIFYIGKKKQ